MLAIAIAFVASTSIFAQEKASPTDVKHVVWIGSDGFGAHYVNWDSLPNLKKMKDAGAWSLHMRSVLPSASAINWETQLTGAPSESHGYRTWGSKVPDLPPVCLTENGRFPDIFYVLKKANPDCTTSVVFTWDGIGYLYDKSALNSETNVETDDEALDAALKQLAENNTFTFIYFGEPDGIGHEFGWGSEQYLKGMSVIDERVGKILNYLEENGRMDDTVVLFTSDHGGTEKGHGDLKMEHMEAPLLFYGKNVKQGEITDVVVHYDVAATIAWLLGAKRPQAWRGLPVEAAFDVK